ncbi:MAG: sodium:proton antiporter [Planctomycetaceae bacterium]|nr:sodium:proton antiporter [Planctomycetaceae bacterium]
MAGLILVTIGYFGWFFTASTSAQEPHGSSHIVEPVEDSSHHDSEPESEKHAEQEHGEAGEEQHASSPPPALYSVIPFVMLLGAIAVFPLFHQTEHWWEHNINRFKVAAGLGLFTLVYYAFLYGHPVEDHFTHGHAESGLLGSVVILKNAILVEYVPFIALLFSLYVISGGIHLRGTLVGKPQLNAAIIGLGGLLASFIGTTGAAMLLIRPLIRANEERRYVAHTIVFFIFVVCNTGGCLLPIGDPPLFLGYLRGVSFLWTLNLWPMWLTMNCVLVAVYYLFDTLRFRHENLDLEEIEAEQKEPISVDGGINFVWLIGVIGCVALLDPSRPIPGTDWAPPVFMREVLMGLLTAVSLITTSNQTRQLNSFNYDAIVEVAALFIGIFICMQPPIQILDVYGSQLGIDEGWKFFWGTGLLSSCLDNAPTYVVFFETARTVAEPGAETIAGVTGLHLIGISLGAVFMGSMTYIGNGPNFMVKAIAEKNNIRMPSFFGYMLYSVAFVLPACILICLIFLRS